MSDQHSRTRSDPAASVARVLHATAGVMVALATGLHCTTVLAAESRIIEEVLVTAEKRAGTVQETAVAITAYDSEALALRGIGNIEDLQFSAPNLVISHNSQSPVTYAYIRAIGSDQLVAGFDPGVAYHVDGVYVGQPSAMPGDLWDLERIEVLRGPQGTLYGRNTTGGSINVITRDPSEAFDATLDVTAGNYDRLQVRGAVGGGITEGVSGRLSFASDENDGYQKNLAGKDGDQTDYTSVRGKLKFDIADAGELVLTAQRFENEGRQSQKRREPFEPVQLAPGFVLFVYDGAIPNPTDPRKVAKDYPEKLDLENTFASARFTWDFAGVQLVSITGYIENEWYQSADIDMSNNPVQFQTWDMETDQFTQELQLISTGEGPWDWILGAFFFDEELSTDYYFEDSSIAGFVFMNGGKLDTRSTALYGQASYDFREVGDMPIRVVGGLRWTQDDKSIDEFQMIPAFGVNLAGSSNESWDEFSGKLGLDWFIQDDVMAYLNLSRGYKGGGFSIGQFDTYDPETVDSVELGLKTQFWDQRAQVNDAAFYNDYQDLQVNFLLFTSFTTDNAAKATIQGIEIESTLLPTDNLTLQANVTFLDAEFDEYQFSPTIDLAGDTLNRAPESTFALSAQYDVPLGAAGTIAARADYYWQDDVYYRVQNIPRHKADDFYTLDLRLLWTSSDGRWEVDAFARNVTDEDNQRGLTVSDGLSTGNSSFVTYYPPRTYGVRVGWHLGE
ncbi:MAG: TonB-dependent receptor [Pseudomonadales bacterium]